MFSKHLMIAAAALATASLALAPAAVKADTSTMTVQTSVANSCQFATTPNVDFGPYTGSNIIKTSTFTYSCTAGDSTYKFGFQSPNATGVGNCSMSDGNGHKLTYTIADSSNDNHNYGCDSGGSFPFSPPNLPSTGSNMSYAFTFTLVGNQTQVVGSYSDTVTVTIQP